MQKIRPKYLAIWRIRLPIPGIVSILHRGSGVALFLAIPFLLVLLEGSLNSPEMFLSFSTVLAYPLSKLILLGLIWAFLHHAFAGIRFLFLDVHKGLDLRMARITAKLVVVASCVLTVIVGWLIW